jgi:GNAT superfamily N-acetyltransferase
MQTIGQNGVCLARQQDIPVLAGLLQPLLEFHHRLRPDILKPWDEALAQAAVADMVAREGWVVWVAWREGSIVGFSAAYIKSLPESWYRRASKVLYVELLVVAPAFRREGVGQALMAEATLRAQAEGASRVEAACWFGNEAVMALAQALGFTEQYVVFDKSVEVGG